MKMAVGLPKNGKKYYCYLCSQEVEPDDVDEIVCPLCNNGFIEELTNAEVADEAGVENTANIMLTNALIQSIARHVQTSPSISPLSSDVVISAHRHLSPLQSEQNVSHSAHPLSACSHSATVHALFNTHGTLTSGGPNAKTDVQSMPQLSTLNCSSPVNSSEFLISRQPEHHASVMPSLSVRCDSMLSPSDSASLPSAALPQSVASREAITPSDRQSTVNDLPPRQHSSDTRNEPEVELFDSRRGVPRSSQSQQPAGSHEPTDVVSDDESDDGTHLIIIRYESQQHEVPRPVSELGSLTHNTGLANAGLSPRQANNLWNAMDLFDRIITQLLNQVDTGPLPASASEIEAVPFITMNESHFVNSSQCTICMEDFMLGEAARQLTCGHIFHTCCIVRWLEMHGTCPVCRMRLGSSRDRRAEYQSAVIQSDSVSSLSSVARVELINDGREGDIVTSIMDDVTDTLLTGTLPDVRETNDSLTFNPAVDDLPLSVSRAPTPVRDAVSNAQAAQLDSVLAAVEDSSW